MSNRICAVGIVFCDAGGLFSAFLRRGLQRYSARKIHGFSNHRRVFRMCLFCSVGIKKRQKALVLRLLFGSMRTDGISVFILCRSHNLCAAVALFFTNKFRRTFGGDFRLGKIRRPLCLRALCRNFYNFL